MIVLGIDLGTSCGWATSTTSGVVLSSGVWRLGHQTRGLALWRHLETERETRGTPALVAYERVVAHGRVDAKRVQCPSCHRHHEIKFQTTNTIAAQTYGGLREVLRMWCEYHSIPIRSVHVATLKLFATGNGRATKEDMVAWAKLRWPEQNVGNSHDQADALHVLDWALVEQLGHTRKAVADVRD